MAKRATLVWLDAQGEGVVSLVNTSTGIGALQAALDAKSSALISSTSEGDIVLPGGTPATTQFITSRIRAVLRFRSVSGSSATLMIPAPLASIFLSDGSTVDPAQVSAITAAAFGLLLAGDGTTVSIFDGGYLDRTRTQPQEGIDVPGMTNPMTTTGDIIYSSNNSGSPARLGIGPAGDVLTVVAGIPGWATPSAGFTITTTTATLGADQALGVNSYTSIVSLTPSAGTYLLFAQVELVNTTVGDFASVELFDGTSALASAEVTVGTPNQPQQASLGPVQVVSTGAQTYSVRGTGTTTGTSAKAALLHNGVGNNATKLVAVRIV